MGKRSNLCLILKKIRKKLWLSIQLIDCLTNNFYLFELFLCSGFTRWNETTLFLHFSHLSVMAPDHGYLAKMYLLHHLVDLPNYNILPPSVKPLSRPIRYYKKVRGGNQKNCHKSSKM